MDRLIFVGLYRLAPNTIKALTIVKPDTLIRWHRAGFRLYWRWKSRHRCGRPTVSLEIRRLIREMSIANPLWGAPRLHGELLASLDRPNNLLATAAANSFNRSVEAVLTRAGCLAMSAPRATAKQLRPSDAR
jgi:hypothetical protein